MCGRFTNRYSWRELKELYDITTPYLTSNFPPRFNIAPTQMSFVVRLNKAGAPELAEMKWGLVPSWAKDAKGGFSTFNAKAETVAEKPAFRAAFRQRPCLVVADGFYEWKKLPGGEKQPWFITRADGKPFAFGGLWEWWRAKDAPEGEKGLESFTIITTEPNALCAQVHDRMPLMLAPEDFAKWLGGVDLSTEASAKVDPSSEALAKEEGRKALLMPFPASDMTMWPVSRKVGNVKNTGAELVERVEVG